MGFRVAFFGTPAFAIPTLAALMDSSHEVVGVITQPDRPRGRGHKLLASPVKILALGRGLPVLQPDRLREESFLDAFAALGADIGVVAAYGRILPQRLLETPRLGMINVHASLLPRWRGAAPVHRAVLAGDRETGITIMRMVPALDAGASLAHVRLTIGPDETSAELESRLAQAGGPLLVHTLDRMEAGPVDETPQDEAGVTYAHRLERHESEIDWARPAADVHNYIRGLHPWPHAAARLGGKRLLILRSEPVVNGRGATHGGTAADTPVQPGTIVGAGPDGLVVQTGEGWIRIVEIQPEGKPPMKVREFLNGHRVQPGDRFEPLSLGT